MKKLALLTTAVLLSLNLFSQAKYTPKVVVVVLGEKNNTFDESMFPDCSFYYTPGITAEVKEIKSLSNKALNGMGIKKEGTEYDITFSGEPSAAYKTKITEAVFFDKNGYVSGLYKNFDNVCTSPKKNLQGAYDFSSYNAISKDYIKKGNETKKAKKAPKKPGHLFDYYGMEFPYDFEVQDAAGKKTMIRELVKGEPLTLFYALYLKPDYDFNAGRESGADKSGKDYINDVLNTNAGIAKLKLLMDVEHDIFGHKVVW